MEAMTAQPYRRQRLREMGVDMKDVGVEIKELGVEIKELGVEISEVGVAKGLVEMRSRELGKEQEQEQEVEEHEKEEEDDRDEGFFPLLSDLTTLKSHSGGCGDANGGSPTRPTTKVPYFSTVECEETMMGGSGDVLCNGEDSDDINDLGSAVDGDGASISGGSDRGGQGTTRASGGSSSGGSSSGGSRGTELLVAAVAVGVMAFAASHLTSLPKPPPKTAATPPTTTITSSPPPPPTTTSSKISPSPTISPTTATSPKSAPRPVPRRTSSPLPSLPSAALFLANLDMDMDSDEEVGTLTSTLRLLVATATPHPCSLPQPLIMLQLIFFCFAPFFPLPCFVGWLIVSFVLFLYNKDYENFRTHFLEESKKSGGEVTVSAGTNSSPMPKAPLLSTHPSEHTHTSDPYPSNTHTSITPSKHILPPDTPLQNTTSTPMSFFSPATIAFATLDNLTTPAATMEERTRAFLSELAVLEEELESMVMLQEGKG